MSRRIRTTQNNGTELELESVNGAWNVGENDQLFQTSEKGCLERMSCDARSVTMYRQGLVAGADGETAQPRQTGSLSGNRTC